MKVSYFIRQSFKKSNVSGDLDVAAAGTAALRDLGNTPVNAGNGPKPHLVPQGRLKTRLTQPSLQDLEILTQPRLHRFRS
jgi:hypothetical protein